ncbi:MAG: 8-oxo-dGTP diphosphatase [Candidatus Andersenbacteria bacterium]|nr:8-oxo-dGTP diphosphatase [Candidatus Andersenbacteria bacterium]
MKKILTLCIIHQHPKILLGMKKRGHGEGKWNGFGGKVEEGETIEEAAIREMREESGVEIKKMNKLGIAEFIYQDGSGNMEVHIFYVKEFEGSPVESEEMKPKWFHVDEIPYDQMWPDDKYWLPMFLDGKNFKGKFFFNEFNEIIDYSLLEL